MTEQEVSAILAEAKTRRRPTPPDHVLLERVKHEAQRWWDASNGEAPEQEALESMLAICEILGVES